MSPTPAIVPSARRATIPEMKTSLPWASMVVACENTPLGWRRRSLMICRFIEAPVGARSARVLVVVVPRGALGIVRAVVDLEHDRFLVRDRRAVHVALGVPVEGSRRQHDTRPRVLVLAAETEHELVGGVPVRLGDAHPLVELDERDRGAR